MPPSASQARKQVAYRLRAMTGEPRDSTADRTESASPSASPGWLAVVAGLLGALACGAVLRDGIVLTPDGWEYWEASLSLLHGRGYTYYGGAPVTSYPPAYSLYLAAVQAVFGQQVFALVVANVLAGGVTVALWVRLAQRLAAPGAPGWTFLLLAGFCSLFVALSYVVLLSETLFLCFLGAALLSLVELARADEVGAEGKRQDRRRLAHVAALTAMATACVLTRNIATVFVPPLALIVWLRLGRVETKRRAVAAATVVLVPALAFLLARQVFEQAGSHLIRMPGWSSIQVELFDIARGFPELLGDDIPAIGVGLTLFALFGLGSTIGAHFRPETEGPRRAARDIAIVAALALVGLVILKSVFPVADPLSGRFLWFFVLTLAALLCAAASWLEARGQATILLLTLFAASLAQGLRIDALPYRYPVPLELHHTLSVEALRAGRAAGRKIRHVVPPPEFDWISQRRGFVLQRERD